MSTAPSSSRRLRGVLVLGAAVASLFLVALAGAGEDLERRMLEVASGLRCPVCQNLSVADSTSEMAAEMRALIVDQLRAGRQPEEIRAYFVSRYGEWILLSPTPRGFGLLVWVLPALAAVAGLGGAAWVLTRWTRRRPVAPAPLVDEAALARIRAAAADDGAGALSPEEAPHVEALRELAFDYRAGKLSAQDYEELRALYERRAVEAVAASGERGAVPREAPRDDSAAGAGRAPTRRRPAGSAWRWSAAAVCLVAFGAAVGFFLSGSVRGRDEGRSITGDPLTGTGDVGVRAASLDLRTILDRGRLAMEAQDFKRAIELFTQALERDPDEPTAHAYLGLILVRAGHPDRALKAFERALAREPALPQALWGKGLVLYEAQGKTAEAIEIWQRLLDQNLSPEDREHVVRVLGEARARMAGGERR